MKPGQHSPEFDKNTLNEFLRVVIVKKHWQFSSPRCHGRDEDRNKFRPCGTITVLRDSQQQRFRSSLHTNTLRLDLSNNDDAYRQRTASRGRAETNTYGKNLRVAQHGDELFQDSIDCRKLCSGHRRHSTMPNHDVPACCLLLKTPNSTTIGHLHMLTYFTRLEDFGILPE
jgi:hypothetical protein